jgi:DNA-binding transcriptional LysR family regulator
MNHEAGADYERSDIDTGWIGWIAAGLGLFVLAVPLVMPLVFPQSMQRIAPQSPPALRADAPALEVTPRENLQRFQRTEDQYAESYGWTDRDRKIVRIPVARAIERLLRSGLPGWPSP